MLRDPQHELYLSAVSVWEIAIKATLGKLHLPEPPRLVIPRETARQGLRSLPVTYLHALGVYDLPLHHGDPFDRLLVAQALSEGLILITANRELKRYSLKILWAGR